MLHYRQTKALSPNELPFKVTADTFHWIALQCFKHGLDTNTVRPTKKETHKSS